MVKSGCLVVIWTIGVAATAAGPSLAQTGSPAPAPQAAPTSPGQSVLDKLTGAAAWAALRGNTITSKSAVETFAEYFDPSGTVKYVDQDGPSSGTWAVKDDKVCLDFPDSDEAVCLTFEVTGTTGSSVADDGATVRFDILPGNSKGL